MLDLFISVAHAQAQGAGGPPPSQGPQFMLMVGIMIGIFYFLIFRPQAKQAREHQALVSGLKKGDQVITGSGIYGKVAAVEERVLSLEVAKGVKIRIDKDKVSRTVNAAAGDTGSPDEAKK